MTTSLVQGGGGLSPITNNVDNIGSAGTHHTDVFGQNAYTTVSDRNEKGELEPSSLGLDFILALEPKQGPWKDFDVEVQKIENGKAVLDADDQPVMETKHITHHRKHQWLIAQDVEQVLSEQGIDTENFAGFIKDTETGKYALRYGEFIPPMIKAIQELSAKIEALEKK